MEKIVILEKRFLRNFSTFGTCVKNVNKMNKIFANILKNSLQSNITRSNYLNNLGKVAFYSSNQYKNEQKSETGERKKTKPIPKISLIHEDSKMEVITLDQAKKIAEKRQLKLVNIIDFDTKSSRPVYK